MPLKYFLIRQPTSHHIFYWNSLNTLDNCLVYDYEGFCLNLCASQDRSNVNYYTPYSKDIIICEIRITSISFTTHKIQLLSTVQTAAVFLLYINRMNKMSQ